MFLKCNVYDSEKLLNAFEMFFNVLSICSNIFGSATTYKGGRGALAPRPPFVDLSATQHCSDWCLNLKSKMSKSFNSCLES